MTLKEWIEDHGLKPTSFAAAVGVPASTITRYLNGETEVLSLRTMRRIAKFTAKKDPENALTPEQLFSEAL